MPRFFPLGVLDDFQPEAPPLGPAPVHTGEHLGPVLRIDPARAGVYGEDGVAVVVLSGEEPGHFLLFEDAFDAPQLLFHFGEQFPVLLGQLEQLLRVGEGPPQPVEKLDPALHPREAGGYGPGLLRIVPETGPAHLVTQLFGLLPQPLHVEERLQLGEAFL